MLNIIFLILFTATSFSNTPEDYFRPQETGASCSLASSAMVVNAILDGSQFITEEDILEISQSSTWAHAVGENGDGLTLQSLAMEIQNLLNKMSLPYDVEPIHMNSRESVAQLEQALEDFNEARGYLILNFDQGLATGKYPGVGHFSPVGRYRASSKKVYVLETDARNFKPYWLTLSRLLESMRTIDPDSGKMRGFIWIRPSTTSALVPF